MSPSGIVATALLAFAAPAQTTVELPVATYVYADGDLETEEGKTLAEVATEVGKKMERRKKTFRVVDDEGDASVVVELLRLWEGESAGKSYEPMNTNDPSRVPIHEFAAVTKTQFAEVEMRVGDEVPLRLTASAPGRRPKDVAEAVRIQVQMYLSQYER